jgi:CrcB protein
MDQRSSASRFASPVTDYLGGGASSMVGVRVRGVDGREYAAIFRGGFVGATARVYLVRELPRGDAAWPRATFIANIVGAFLLGYFSTRLRERLPVSAYRRPLLGTGF